MTRKTPALIRQREVLVAVLLATKRKPFSTKTFSLTLTIVPTEVFLT